MIIYRRTKFREAFSGSRFFIFGFSLFIVLCGLTHGWDVVTMYVPLWHVDSLLRVATATASLYVAVAFIPFAKTIINRPTREEYLELEARANAAELKASQAALELLRIAKANG